MKKNTRKPNKKNSSSRVPANDNPARQTGNVTDEPRTTFPIVGIGASAGGLEAFEQLLGAIPRDIGMAFVIVQHLAPNHQSILSELLAKCTALPVMDVTDGTRVEPNHVYVIPPNAHLTVQNGRLLLAPMDPDRSRRLPIDSFFRSLAEECHSGAIGVVLSGMASDGTLGLQAIKAAGGITFAQDDRTARYGGMPRSAIVAGNVDFVLSPDLIAKELIQIAAHANAYRVPQSREAASSSSETLNKIFQLLKTVTRVDFSNYKPSISRRISRRMFLKKVESMEEYLTLLRKSLEEVNELFNEMLINVTSFFRDPEAFDALKSVAFPIMTKSRPQGAPIRIWVPGCSSGEETYSLAIALLEYLGEDAGNIQIQIFATDLSEAIIQKARAGVFSENIAADVSAERLRRFFVRVDGSYQVKKSIRDICIFAKQDLTRDPPFSKLDLICCRNVMIYLGQVLQKRILPLFHYALNPDGLLFLGSSETVGQFGELFSPVDKKHKLYVKCSVPVTFNLDFVAHFSADESLSRGVLEPPAAISTDLQRITEQLLLSRYAPAGVVVNDNLDILQFVGRPGPFLEPAPGDATLSLMKMVKAGLHGELRSAFQKARRDGMVRKENILIEQSGGLRTVSFEIMPLKNLSVNGKHYLLVFEDEQKPAASKKPPKANKKETTNTRVRNLEEELGATREYLQSIIEEQRTTNEELRSANEEIQSSNEELQSINEELETAKEELQSTNEELTTVNEELQNRNDELTHLNNDLNNLLSSVNIPIIMLGSDLRIRRFTPMAEKVMNLIPSDIGRPFTDIKPNINEPNLKRMITHVIDSLEITEMEVQDTSGKSYSLRIRPYRTSDNRIDGVVMVLLERMRSEVGAT